MSAARPYRFYLALFFLALYAFIATPVQWWHHHPASKMVGTALAKSAGKAGIAASSSSIITPDCPLCSHQYSVYYTYPSPQERIAVPVFPSPAMYRLVALLETPPGDLPNKSPPDCLLNSGH